MPLWKLYWKKYSSLLNAIASLHAKELPLRWWSWALLVFGIGFSAMLGIQAKEHADRLMQADLKLESAKITSEIGANLNACTDALLAGRSLFAVRQNVSCKDWHKFVDALKLSGDSCGNLGLGFAKVMTPNHLDVHVSNVRREGFPNYSVRPSGKREIMTPVVYLEPFSGDNLRAVGYDMFSEPVRRAAMEKARDTGKVAVTRKVQLIQDDMHESIPAILVYAPVYQNDALLNTVQQRRDALIGWVYSPHRIPKLMAAFDARSATSSPNLLEMKIYDSAQESDSALLYSSNASNTPLPHSMFFHKRKVELNGSSWWIEFDRNPRAPPINYFNAWFYFISGVIGSLFVFSLTAVIRRSSKIAHFAMVGEEALRQQNANLTTILEHLPGGVTMVDSNLKLIKFNQEFLRLLGYTESELPFSNISLLDLIQLHIDQGDTKAQAHTDALMQSREKGKPTYDLERQLPNGKTIQVHGTVLQGGGLVTFYADNTLQKSNELQLRKLSAAVDQSPNSILITDVDGKIEYVNDAFLHLTGLSAEEVIGSNPRILGSGQTPAETYQHMWSALREGKKWTGELTNKRMDGSLYINQVTISPIKNSDGVVTHYVSAQEDITERKKADAELLQYRLNLEELVNSRTAELVIERDRAESAVRAKSEFLSNMSHEIRTPIHAIMGFAMLCQQTALPARAMSHVRKITLASESLLGIINDILDASKLEAGMLAMENVEFDLGEVLARIGSLFQLKAAEKGLELVIGSAPEVPELLIGDGYRLGQVLTNLISNAIKFTETGEVRLRVKLVDRGPAFVTLLFLVRDTGISMTQTQAAKLFTAFSQADNSITRKFGGSGLGLAISQQLVKKMHGLIELDTHAGKGTTFRFSVRFGLAKPGEPASERVNALIGKQVLVVEDNQLMRRLHVLNLISYGCKVISEESGEAALVAFERTPHFDFVILDLHLPGINGLETAHRMRQTGRQTCIILITADNLDVADASVANGDIDAVLPKPVSRRILGDAMRDLASESLPSQVNTGIGIVAKPDFSGRRILVVDDNEFNREIAVGYIKATGALVDAAVDGELAVSAAGKSHYDLILMDIQMPVMDGYTAAGILRKQFPDLAIIALTANAMAEEKDRVLASGMQGILTKPFMPAALYATINTWLPDRSQQTAKLDSSHTENSKQDLSLVFDHATALLRANSEPSILDKFLRMFMKQNHRTVELLASAMQAGDKEVARRQAHSVKGGAGMVALTELQTCAGQLESSLLQNIRGTDNWDACSNGFAVLLAAWLRAKATIEPMLDGGQIVASPAVEKVR